MAGDKRVIGISDHDEVMGRMIERTSVLAQQAQVTDRTLNALNETISRMNITLTKLDGAVINVARDRERDVEDIRRKEVEQSKLLHALSLRLAECEKWDPEVKFIRMVRGHLARGLITTAIASFFAVVSSVKFGWPFNLK